MKESKIKLPELKVQSFVTSLDDEQLQQINGAGVNHGTTLPGCPDTTFAEWCSGIGCSQTCTACSTTDHLPYTEPCGCTTEP